MAWILQKAEEFCEGVTDGTHDSPKAVEYGRYLITSKHLGEYEIDFSSAKMISEEDYKKVVARSKVGQWDILFSMIGTIGNTYLEKNEAVEYACKNMGIFQMGGDQEKAYWLYYYLKSPQAYEYISSQLRGSTQQYVPLGGLREFPIPVPDIKIRRKIVEVLKIIDEKIDTNIKINRNLEEQLTAVYNEWFGMYKPYNIGIGGEPNYELDEGWKVADIYSIANIIYGAPFASKLFNVEGDGIPIVRIRDLKNQELVTYTTEKHPKGYLIKHGDIVVGMDGEFRPYIWGNDAAWLNQRVCIFDNIRENGKAFLYCTIKPLLHSVEATELATTVIHIGKKDFDEFRVVLPPEDMLVQFEALSKGMYDKIVECQVENRRLVQLRDTLLPKLMSGELDVSDLEI